MKKKSAKKSSGIVSLFSRIFKFRTWLDIDRVRGFFLYMLGMTKKMVVVPEKNKTQSFQAVAKEMGVNETEINKQGVALLWWSRLLFLVALLILGIGIYHAINGNIRAGITSVLIMCVGLTLSFRYNFLSFQIKHKKLGCTVNEWFKNGLMGGSKK